MIPLSPPHTRVSLSLILEEYWYSHGNDPIPYLVLAHDVNYSQLLIFFFQNVVPIFKKSNVLEGVRALIDHLKEKQSTVEMNPRSKQLKRKKREKKWGNVHSLGRVWVSRCQRMAFLLPAGSLA